MKLKMRPLGTKIVMTVAALSAAMFLGVLGCGSGVEEVSTTTAHQVRSSVAQIEGLSKSGCKFASGDTGLIVERATGTLVTAAAHHAGATVDGVPLAQVIKAAAAPARACGYTNQAKSIAFAALAAGAKTN
jgi:hypothetical protein